MSQIIIQGKTFTQSGLVKEMKNLLHTLPKYLKIQPPDPIFYFLEEAFKYHPNYDIKVGPGIEYFSIENIKYEGNNFGNFCFHITRKDGSNIDISVNMLFKKTGLRNDVELACRTSIQKIIEDYRNKILYGYQKCPVTGEILTKQNTHIDHSDLTWKELFNKWYEKNKNIEIFLKKGYGCSFVDKNIEKDFINFHNRNTHLIAVLNTVNTGIFNISKITADNLKDVCDAELKRIKIP